MQTWMAATAAALNAMMDGASPLLPMGMDLFRVFAVISLTTLGWSIAFGPGVDQYLIVRRLFTITAVFTLLTFWNVPMPGVGMELKRVIPAQGAYVTELFGTQGIEETSAHLDELLLRIEAPNVLTALGGVRTMWFYMLFSGFILFVKAVTLCVLSFSLISLAVTLSFAPMVWPFFLVPRFDSMAWGLLRLIAVFSLMPAVGAAWSLVSARLLWSTLNSLPPGNLLEAPGYYGVVSATLLATLIGCVGVPILTGLIFSHAVHSGHTALTAVASRVVR